MRWLTIVVGAGLIGCLLDHIHVTWNVLAYTDPHPGLFGQPWWVAPEFGIGALLLTITSPGILDASSVRSSSRGQLFRDSIWFAGVYLASGIGAHAPILLTCLLGLALIGRVLARRMPQREFMLMCALAILGPTWESLLSATGAFHYTAPDFAGVPMWLPLLYAHGALLIPATLELSTPTSPY